MSDVFFDSTNYDSFGHYLSNMNENDKLKLS